MKKYYEIVAKIATLGKISKRSYKSCCDIFTLEAQIVPNDNLLVIFSVAMPGHISISSVDRNCGDYMLHYTCGT